MDKSFLRGNSGKIIGPECAVPVRMPNENRMAITEAVLEYSREQAAKDAVVGHASHVF